MTTYVEIEVYFSRCLGFTLATVSVIALFFTGTIPLSSSSNPSPDIPDASDERAPYTIPIIAAATFYHAVSLIYCYVRWVNERSGQAGYLLGCLGYGVLAAMGLWCIVFGSESGRKSRRTGADKRTTGYPFANANAYDKKKDKKLFREIRTE